MVGKEYLFSNDSGGPTDFQAESRSAHPSDCIPRHQGFQDTHRDDLDFLKLVCVYGYTASLHQHLDGGNQALCKKNVIHRTFDIVNSGFATELISVSIQAETASGTAQIASYLKSMSCHRAPIAFGRDTGIYLDTPRCIPSSGSPVSCPLLFQVIAHHQNRIGPRSYCGARPIGMKEMFRLLKFIEP